LIHSIAARVPQTSQTHRTALALSLPYNLERLDRESRTNVVAALATDGTTRAILVEASRNSQTSQSVQTEIARVLSHPGQQAVIAGVSAAQGGLAAAPTTPAGPANRQEEVLRAAAVTAVRVAEIGSPTARLFIQGARFLLPNVVGDPTGLPPYVESLLWTPSGSSSWIHDYVLPIAQRDLPAGYVGGRNAAQEGHRSSLNGTTDLDENSAAGERAGRQAIEAGQSVQGNPSAPAPVPQRILDAVIHPDPVQTTLIGIGMAFPTLLPAVTVAATLQGSGLLSQAGQTSFAPAFGAVTTYATVTAVSSSTDAHPDSEGSGSDSQGHSPGGDDSHGEGHPNQENPQQDPDLRMA